MTERIFTITIKVKANVEKGVSVDNIVNELDYDVKFNGDEATILDTEITDWNLIK